MEGYRLLSLHKHLKLAPRFRAHVRAELRLHRKKKLKVVFYPEVNVSAVTKARVAPLGCPWLCCLSYSIAARRTHVELVYVELVGVVYVVFQLDEPDAEMAFGRNT